MHDTTIRESLIQLARAVDAAYNEADAARMAACWTDNGLNVNPFGDRFEGRASIEADLAQTLDGFMKGTTHELAVGEVMSLGEDVAAADGVATIRGIYGDPAQALASDFSMICTTDEQGGWRIAQMRAYRYLPRHA